MASIIDIANDIIKQVDIVDIISRYIKVNKKGRDYICLCPFHDDHHESMHISPEKGIFKDALLIIFMVKAIRFNLKSNDFI